MLDNLFWCVVSFIGFMMIYILIDRVCRCFERCSMNKTLGKTMCNLDNDVVEKLTKKD